MAKEARTEMHLIGISPKDEKEDVFIMILGEDKGTRRVPIQIGPFEAQSIALALDRIPITRPLTHDLLLQLVEEGEKKLEEVYIDRLENGVFSAHLGIKKGQSNVQVDCRSSDAIALAVRKGCPIYLKTSILDEVGFANPTATPASLRPLENHSLEELKAMLSKALEEENYERAQRISHLIEQKEKG